MRIKCALLLSLASFTTSSCVLAQDSFVIREVFQAPIISSISGLNREGWYVREGYGDEGPLQAVLVGPSDYQRDVSAFVSERRQPTGVTSNGDLFLAESSGGKTKILRLPREASVPVEVGVLKTGRVNSAVRTNNLGETLAVTFEGSRFKIRGVRVTTLSKEGKVSIKRSDLSLSLPIKDLYLQIFPESQGRFTIVASRVGATRTKGQKAVCTGGSDSKDLACQVSKGSPLGGGSILTGANGKLLVADGSGAALVDASTLKVEQAITDESGNNALLTSFIEADGTLGALVQDFPTDVVRLKLIAPSGKSSSYLCPSSLGWQSLTFLSEYIGSIDRGSTGFLVSGWNEGGEGSARSYRLYELTADNASSEAAGGIVGRCELEEQKAD